ncbi:hypothetical protein [Leptodesmis sp.]|uniref:hypothetical protein n=1 Tax=Leptodesmis sp. TaxID=3100501 RepID=UPI0040535AF3
MVWHNRFPTNIPVFNETSIVVLLYVLKVAPSLRTVYGPSSEFLKTIDNVARLTSQVSVDDQYLCPKTKGLNPVKIQPKILIALRNGGITEEAAISCAVSVFLGKADFQTEPNNTQNRCTELQEF